MKKFGIILLVMAACGPSGKDQELLDQSWEIHEKAMLLSSSFNDTVSEIESTIAGVADSLTLAIQDSVEVLKADYTQWDSEIVEVADSHADHDHAGHDHHDHDHHHAPAPDLTPQMMLEVQRVILTNIEALSARAQNVLSMSQGLVANEVDTDETE